MVEPISVGVVVAALLAKALDRAEEGAVDRGVEAGRKAIQALRERFARDGDAEADRAVEGLAEAPDSGRREKALAVLLEERAAQSPELRDELRAIAAQIEGAGVAIGSVEQIAEGDSNLQIGGVSGSTIDIDRGRRRPRD